MRFLGGIAGYSTKDDIEKYRVVRVNKKTGQERNLYRNLTLDEALFLADKKTYGRIYDGSIKETSKSYVVVVKDKRK